MTTPTLSAVNDLPSLPELKQAYANATLLPSDLINQVLVRIEAAHRPEIWISQVAPTLLHQQAQALDKLLQEEGPAVLSRLPLFGVPFAVKDNIDVAGMNTTAACPAFSFLAERSATVVEKLQAAGAILIGKTNLDQFATGLVGARSPYGAVRNAVNPDYVSGGSSSGSGVAVALGLVSFSLGTDTAGSGRVPAGLNGIVGLKPTRGLISTRGVFPACRTLDCVSIFARHVADAWSVTQVAAGYDAEDSYSRKVQMAGGKQRRYRIAVPAQLEFFGDRHAEKAFTDSLEQIRQRPDCIVDTIDFQAFTEAAALLYQGPWVAERLAAVGDFYSQHKDAMNPVVAGIIGQGANYSAVDAFNGHYKLAALRRTAETALADFDFLLVPTTPTMPTLAALEKEPVQLNSQLGYYTNFVNFFDMAALSVPALPRADGLPAGLTLIGAAGSDHLLAAAAACLLPAQQTGCAVASQVLPFNEPTVQLAVVGAHLEGQPLNWQLQERGARKLETTQTAPCYQLVALPNTTPAKPGLARLAEGGCAIEIEIWEMPLRRFGEFVADVPAPLAIGSLETQAGQWVKGFVCEPIGLVGATDISGYGGWRAYLAG